MIVEAAAGHKFFRALLALVLVTAVVLLHVGAQAGGRSQLLMADGARVTRFFVQLHAGGGVNILGIHSLFKSFDKKLDGSNIKINCRLNWLLVA